MRVKVTTAIEAVQRMEQYLVDGIPVGNLEAVTEDSMAIVDHLSRLQKAEDLDTIDWETLLADGGPRTLPHMIQHLLQASMQDANRLMRAGLHSDLREADMVIQRRMLAAGRVSIMPNVDGVDTLTGAITYALSVVLNQPNT